MKRDGPVIKMTASCLDCRHERTEGLYCAEAEETDWFYFCEHPSVGGRAKASHITPAWCPLLVDALTAKASHITPAWCPLLADALAAKANESLPLGERP